MYYLDNVLRNYAWGSATAIADLLGREPSGSPEAELWIGAHPDSPSVASAAGNSHAVPLQELIATDPERFLGTESLAAFGPRLPFLTKILAAGQPLSLQVHPTLEQARAGFARENAGGVALDSAQRNYRDDNHKPEMIFALSDFHALCGFRTVEDCRAIFGYVLDILPEDAAEARTLVRAVLDDLGAPEESSALRSAFERLINGGAEVSQAIPGIVALSSAVAPTVRFAGELATLRDLNKDYPGDPGVLISLLLNRIVLAPGEAVYLPAGNVHAYLSGLGVEVMATSDNVLRGGLTPKHIDIPELLKTISFESVGVPRLTPQRTVLDQEVYRPPFREFCLQRIEVSAGSQPVPAAQSGAAILIVVTGEVNLDSPRGGLHLHHGASAFLPAAEAPVNVHPVSGATETAVVFVVTTGLQG